MPTRKTVEKLGFKALGYECNEEGEVTFVFCKTCREFYSDQRKHEVVGSSTFIKDQVDKYLTGTSVVKKNNFSEYLKKSMAHLSAVKGLSQHTETEAPPPDQKTIVTCVRNQNKKLKDQLVMKFQLAHFTAIHGELFKLYQNIVNFEKQIDNVDLGQSYLTDTSCREMLFCLSKSIVLENIMKLLNDGMI